MSRSRKQRQQQPNPYYLSPSDPQPYVGQWIHATIPRIGPVIAYIANYNPNTGVADLWFYRPGQSLREGMQYQYSDLIGVTPYYGPIPPYYGGPTPPQPLPPRPPQPTPPPYQPYPPIQRSCRNYRNRSQQLACLMGLIPPI